jgi:NADPH:quinone reductase-like Zn-dependent oxidoreductase
MRLDRSAGGDRLPRSYGVIHEGGILVTAIKFSLPQERAGADRIHSTSIMAAVTSARPDIIRQLIEDGELKIKVETVLPLKVARRAHAMLEGALHAAGKMV